ncbi:Na+/H+ antiporter NhaC family protein [Sinanaerobacter sp. ZZT-01]|uniref:Na+/H+ antiporter NhaC family protein n=1 Tax=Sinanaerobacter sp. ZZT-01 TaxID=3111540 RepID=UPI002D79DD36|nr:Na+/H+ antiporter NhaC family protein [Sinanaerobacter sp. ZZT-01]WRR94839.1 Na+/H+ antiporter NhaC family protein [Sinanaerobacter sp. ZZT-01]
MEYGIISLVPVLVILAVAIITRKTTSSLLLGVVVAYIIMHGLNFVYPFIDLIYEVCTDPDTIWVIAFSSLIGVVIALLEMSGAMSAVTNILVKYSNTQKKSKIAMWILGVLLFIDDYLSVSVRGAMSKIFDENKVPRVMFAYILDSTASPLCILVPITTWAIFYQSVFGGFEELSSYGTAYGMYLNAIPFMFYGWIALIICLLVAMDIIPPIGAMKKEYERAERTGKLYSDASDHLNTTNAENSSSEKEDNRSDLVKILCFVIPVAILVTISIVTGDVLMAELVTIAASYVLYLVTKSANWNELMEASFKGVNDMLIMVLIIIAALMVKTTLIQIGLPDFVIEVAKPYMSPALLPAITFAICGVLSFATGSTWGVTVAAGTILVPLCVAIAANPILLIAAIVSGAAFGAHICFYADVTVFSSIVSKVDNMDHAITQLPYGLISAGLSLILFVIAGYAYVI